jgi:hypothetical protein
MKGNVIQILAQLTRRGMIALFLLFVGACEWDAATTPVSPEDRAATLGLSGDEREFSFTTIAVEGALTTNAQGINAGGDIVGWYVDANSIFHGFLLRDDVFTTIDYPGAVFTDARGIGPGGEIVGTYRLPGEPAVNFHGFLLTRQGEFLPVDYPGHTNTIAQRVLPDGTILGCRHDDDLMATMRGVLIGRSGNDEIDEFASMHNGATPDLRRIAGLYTNMMANRTEGYVIDDGVFTPLLVQGSNLTAAWDVNPAGEVVGFFRDATGLQFHGFLLTADEYVPIDVPGATATRAFGINARGDIVGNFVAGGSTFGFLAR